MNSIILGIIVFGGLVLIGVGVWSESRRKPVSPAAPVMVPITPPEIVQRPRRRINLRQIIRGHPAPILALIEMGVWLMTVVIMISLLRSPRESWIGFIVWALTILPHEMGHIICTPFGWGLMMAGGSIWQVLIFVLAAVFSFWVRRQISTSLLFWVLAGYSLINLSVYIDDARARQLPLLFGASKDHHDWWNLLGKLDLLEYDHLLASLVSGAGVVLVIGAVALGVVTAWVLPRTRLGTVVRYEEKFWRTLVKRLSEIAEPGDNI
ncbi:MAG: hypothetical protein HY866_16940 [Chloroflexi bacterium]|nr:hypothetical protein [Chloroflexota bacterium]